MKNIAFVFLLLTSLIVSCGSDEEIANKDVLVAKSDYKIDEFQNYYFAIKEKYKYVPFGIHADTIAYFIVSDKSLEMTINAETNDYNPKKVKLGLVDFTGKEILAKEYKKIGNVGVLGSNLVEIESINGKYGVCDLKSGKFTNCEYDLVIPIKNNSGDCLALLKKGNTFQTLNADFTISESSISEFSKCLAVNRSSFNAFEKGVYYYIQGSEIERANFNLESGDSNDEDYYSMCYFTPNYIYRFYTDKQIFTEIYSNGEWGLNTINGKIEATESKNGLYTFIVSFFYEGSSGRDFSNEEGKIVTMNANNDIIEYQSIFNVSEYDNYTVCSVKRTHRFVKNNLLEVMVHKYSSEYDIYDEMPIYTYFNIDEKGVVKDVTPKGAFGFVSMITITKKMLESCLGRYTEESEIPEGMNEETNYVSFAHYSIEDLEMMISEIMARHGYNFFDNEELKDYFSSKSWYVGNKSDVSNLFTELEKNNINIIVEVIMSMKDNEELFTKPSYTTYYAAG